MTVAIAACPNHPQREAIGVCVRCRRRVCSECATKVDGINYCVDCLATLASRPTRRRSLGASERASLVSYLSAGAYLFALGGLTWFLLEVMLPGGSPR